MLVVAIKGGLGNQMYQLWIIFQSMLIKFFADRHNPLFKRYSDFYTAGDFDPKILNVEHGFIDGYWQSFKYFSGMEDNLRMDLRTS